VLPESDDLKTPSPYLAAKRVDGVEGSIARTVTLAGEVPARAQERPESVDLKTPFPDVPAKRVDGVVGLIASALIRLAMRPAFDETQVSPESTDLKRPVPSPA